MSIPLGVQIGSDVPFLSLPNYGAAEFAKMKAAGFSRFRTDAFYAADGSVSRDGVIRAAVAAGLRVLIVINGYHPNLTTQAQYVAYVSTVVARYSAIHVHDYEICNEVNNAKNWDTSGIGLVNPAAYTALLGASYAAAKAADPTCTIVFGSPGGFYPDGGSVGGGNYHTRLSPVTWVNLCYAAMGGNSSGYFDVMGAHPYTWPAVPSATAFNYTDILATTTPSVRASMVANGDLCKPMWVTEFGAPTGTDAGQANPITPAAQAAQFTAALATLGWLSWSHVQVFFAFSWNDNPIDGDFGLNDVNFVAKPALAAIRAAAGITP